MSNHATVLVIDDEKDLLELVRYNLEKEHLDVITASDGQSGLEIGLKHKPDLVLLDLMMPGMNGRELAMVARRQFPKLRVLYVTGFADTLFKDLTELSDGESFIEKPFGTDGLLEATRLLMFGHISDGQQSPDKRDDEKEWDDDRLRAKIVRLLRKLRMA